MKKVDFNIKFRDKIEKGTYTYSQCVPFEGNEKLLRTQDPIPPFYDIRKKK